MITSHPGRELSREQIGVASVLYQAIGTFSEETYCAGWMSDIEHHLWDKVDPPDPDSYSRAVDYLYAAAGKERSSWGDPGEHLGTGLRLLAERFQVWVYWREGAVAIHLADWKPMHAGWREERLKERSPLEEVWERIHNPFSFRTNEDNPVVVPPMPKFPREISDS
jgi:hypothetical protein